MILDSGELTLDCFHELWKIEHPVPGDLCTVETCQHQRTILPKMFGVMRIRNPPQTGRTATAPLFAEDEVAGIFRSQGGSDEIDEPGLLKILQSFRNPKVWRDGQPFELNHPNCRQAIFSRRCVDL